MTIKRRLKSVTAPRHKKKTSLTPSERKARLKSKLHYKTNKHKILKAAKERRKHLTPAEKDFNKKRAAFLRKTRPKTGLIKRTINRVKKYLHL